MKKNLFIGFLLAFWSWSSFAQTGFERTYNIVSNDEGNDIVQMPDGKYTFLSTFKGGYSSIYLASIDAAGSPLWNYTYPSGSLSGVRARSIQQTADKGFLIFGDSIYCPNIACLNDIYVLKVDSMGHRIGAKSYTLPYTHYFRESKPTADGGFIIVGTNTIGGSTMLKINALGSLEWTKSHSYPSGQGMLALAAIATTNDGGYVMTGSGKFGSRQLLLFKTNAIGDTLWTKSFGDNALSSSSYYKGKAVMTDNQQNILVLADSSNGTTGGANISLLKTDSLGNVLWQKKYGGAADEAAISLEKTSDNGLIVLGNTKSFGNGGSDIYVVKTDASGNVLWSKTFGRSRNDFASAIKQTSDGGFIIVGSTQIDSLNFDVFIVKIDSLGNSLFTSLENDAPPLYGIAAFPNPFSLETALHVNQNLKSASLTLYNLLGQAVKQIDNLVITEGQPFVLSRENLPAGPYFLAITVDGKVIAQEKLVIF